MFYEVQMPDHFLVWIGVVAVCVATIWALTIMWKRVRRGKRERRRMDRIQGPTATFEHRVPELQLETRLHSPGPAPASYYLWNNLSLREREVAVLWTSGKSSGEIGPRLGISRGTVRSHIKKVYAVLQVHNRAELIQCMREIEEYEKRLS